MAEYKLKAIIEVKKGDRTFAFECENNTPLGEIFDSINEMRAVIVHAINDSAKQEQQKGTADGESKPEGSCCS